MLYFGINQYALKVQQSLTRYSESFQSSDLRYSLLLNMTMDDINQITTAQIETINLIDNIHRPKDFWMNDLYYPLADCSISCLELQGMRMSDQ